MSEAEQDANVGLYPRALSAHEEDVLDFMLRVDDSRVDPLRRQRESVLVTGMCSCGCASIYLAVDREHATAADLCTQPIEADLTKAARELIGPREAYGLLLFLKDGWLSKLEIWWIDNPPPEFPPTSRFERSQRTC